MFVGKISCDSTIGFIWCKRGTTGLNDRDKHAFEQNNHARLRDVGWNMVSACHCYLFPRAHWSLHIFHQSNLHPPLGRDEAEGRGFGEGASGVSTVALPSLRSTLPQAGG